LLKTTSKGESDLKMDIEDNKGYRNRLEIIKDILKVTENAGTYGVKKTHIMYGANLSYRLLIKYLQETLNAELICRGESCYIITQKGKEYLGNYEKYIENRTQTEDHINNLNNNKKTLEKLLIQ
jgi:predicted transcriptional regulator